MNKKIKKGLSVLLATVLATGCLTAAVAYGSDSVAIDETNFPDANFREYISDTKDLDGDGYLSASERNITMMSVTEDNEIKTLKGIENFTSLKILRCSNIGLEELDVSALSELTALTCMGNQLTTLDLFNNGKLQRVNCSDNSLTSLRLLSSSLTQLDCYANNLKSLDLSLVSSLQKLRCDQNELTSLDLTNNPQLVDLNCTYNHLTDLNLSKNTKLTDVTNAMIGEQTIELKATFDGSMIIVPFTEHKLDSSNYVSSSLEDYGDGAGFTYDKFVAYDVSEIDNGITYYCSTKLEGSENMKVDVTVSRDFHQVNFYSNADCTDLIGKAFANDGGTVKAPDITNPPQCKVLDTWSDSLENVTEDKSIYANWKDNHNYALTSFDGDTATVKCSACGDSFTLSYIDAVNSKTGDEKYSKFLDVTGDGVINAKDFSKLNKMK